jgi:hypothetical protein
MDGGLFLSFPDDSAEVSLSWVHDARSRRRFYEEFVAFNSNVASLLAAIPLFIPGDIDRSDEVFAFDAVLAGIREHGLVQRSSFRVAHSSSAAFRGGQYHNASLAREDEVAFGMRSENILRSLVVDNHLPRDEFPGADEAFCFCPEQRPGED